MHVLEIPHSCSVVIAFNHHPYHDRGANMEARTDIKLTPLLVAAQEGQDNIVELMLGAGACIRVRFINLYRLLCKLRSRRLEAANMSRSYCT